MMWWRTTRWGLALTEAWSSAWSISLITSTGWKKVLGMLRMTTYFSTAQVINTSIEVLQSWIPSHDGWKACSLDRIHIIHTFVSHFRSDWAIHSSSSHEAVSRAAPAMGVSCVWRLFSWFSIYGGKLQGNKALEMLVLCSFSCFGLSTWHNLPVDVWFWQTMFLLNPLLSSSFPV